MSLLIALSGGTPAPADVIPAWCDAFFDEDFEDADWFALLYDDVDPASFGVPIDDDFDAVESLDDLTYWCILATTDVVFGWYQEDDIEYDDVSDTDTVDWAAGFGIMVSPVVAEWLIRARRHGRR